MHFLDLKITDDVPDSKVIWHFEEKLTDLEVIEPLFNLFLDGLEKLGLIVNEGKIVAIETPRLRDSRKENGQIKSGKAPGSFVKDPKKKADLQIQGDRRVNTQLTGNR